ncbi:MAG: GNAT family N-acetyltransferase [Alphaproteobacteria bacterium]|nr:GNAT family N-acetyltransferase [Alphaproteobacteria bacterium]
MSKQQINQSENMIEIKLVRDNLQRQAVYHLRYEVFAKEQRDFRYANEVTKTYQDIWDHDPSTIVLIAISAEKEIIGSLRLVFRKVGPYLGDNGYEYEKLAYKLGIPLKELFLTTVIITRGVVRKEYRRLGVFKKLLSYAEALCKKHNANILIGATSMENDASKELLLSLEFNQYTRNFNENGWEGEYHYKIVS